MRESAPKEPMPAEQKSDFHREIAHVLFIDVVGYSKMLIDGNEENLALIRTIIGENNGAISTLARLLEVPYQTTIYGTPITPALLRLDPTRDPLRADPAFRKLCEEKKE
jgi:hypothetical protein